MRNDYAIARCKLNSSAPFIAKLELRPWGKQWVISDNEDCRVLMPSLMGNSKQRRQQLRTVLRKLNEV